MNTGLVLEGGGMRGAYTAGVLQYFMENDVYFPYVIGVSAGACQGSSYVSKQMMRNKLVTVDYITHPDYLSFKNFLKKGEIFGMDFLFHDLPMIHAPFDFEAFRTSPQTFVVGVTDCENGKPRYYEKNELSDKELLTVLRASSSLPYMAPKVSFQGKMLLDGGVSDPIPIKKSEKDGNQKNVVILTRNEGYRKKKSRAGWFVKNTYRQHKGLTESILQRYQTYNRTIDYIEEKEQQGDIFIIRPTKPLEVGRMERDKEKLTLLYEQGYEDAKNSYEPLVKWMNS